MYDLSRIGIASMLPKRVRATAMSWPASKPHEGGSHLDYCRGGTTGKRRGWPAGVEPRVCPEARRVTSNMSGETVHRSTTTCRSSN